MATDRFSPAIEARFEQYAKDREPYIRQFLAALEDRGGTTVLPDAQARGYLNVESPPGHGPANWCCVILGTGRVYFGNAYDLLEAEGLGNHFDRIPSSGQAARYLDSEDAVRHAVQAAELLLRSRRGT